MNILSMLKSETLIKFIIVGIMNTLIGTSIMFFAYNVLEYGYWFSSALNYFFGSIFSYFANKYYTFEKKGKSLKESLRFIVNIIICYLIAYSISEPIIKIIFNPWIDNVSLVEQVAMVLGMVIFVILNYFGQKLIVFKSN